MRGWFVVSVLSGWGVLAACSKGVEETPDSGAADAMADAADAAPAVDASAPEASRGALVKLGATAQTSVLDGQWWPESSKGTKRLGYLRHGAVVMAYANPTTNEDCKDGWYELEVGGYVCGKAASTDVTSPKVRLAPKQPDHDAGMPYKYGVNCRTARRSTAVSSRRTTARSSSPGSILRRKKRRKSPPRRRSPR